MRLPTRQDGVENRDKVYSKNSSLQLCTDQFETSTLATALCDKRRLQTAR